jgi:NitT/TauT family transport system substrate-binding protein
MKPRPRTAAATATLVAAGAFLLFFAGCGAGSDPESEPKALRIAEQYGLAYAPLSLMKQYGLLEEKLPEYEVTWTRLTNAASIREAIVARRLDVGFMGIPPFLIGVDRGMDWRVFSALSEVPLGLVTLRDDYADLSALAEGRGRIAVPQPGSIQHILLSMAAERRFGDAGFFDDQLVTLSHPDAAQAMVQESGVDAHFATPPYLLDLTSVHGGRILLGGAEAFGGEFTFAVGVAPADFLRENPEFLEAFGSALGEAVDRLGDQESLDVLAGVYGISPVEVRQQLEQEGMRFSAPLRGVESFSRFMAVAGYLTEDVAETQTLVYDGSRL